MLRGARQQLFWEPDRGVNEPTNLLQIPFFVPSLLLPIMAINLLFLYGGGSFRAFNEAAIFWLHKLGQIGEKFG